MVESFAPSTKPDAPKAVFHPDHAESSEPLSLVSLADNRTEGGTPPPVVPPPGRGEGGGGNGGAGGSASSSSESSAAASASANARGEGGKGGAGGQGGIGEGGTASATNGGNALNFNQRTFIAPPAVSYDSGHQVCGGKNLGISTIFGGIGGGDSTPSKECWAYMDESRKQHLVELACSSGVNVASLAHDGYIKVADLAAQIARNNPAARSEVAAMGALTTQEAVSAADLLAMCTNGLRQRIGGAPSGAVIGNISLDSLPPPAPPAPPPHLEVTPLPPPVVHHRPVHHAPPKKDCVK